MADEVVAIEKHLEPRVDGAQHPPDVDAALDLGTADAAFPCDGGAACEDDDPCTVDRCVEGDCVWTRPDAGLEV
ncbi:MAG: hypothetical protein KC619_24255, partial [Myxococcales bacterium]|nr:hypothetical protein [Myxococcales bacterium]